MKEKLKKILFIISMFYSLVVIILMCITMNNLVTEVELYDLPENQEKLMEYKEQLATLPQNSCTDIIGKIITHYEETIYNGKVNLREMYEYDMNDSLLSYYLKAKDNCNINEELEKGYNLPDKFITASIQRDESYQRYYFQYELKITDYMTRLIVEPVITNLEYHINRTMILDIISSLIEISSREGLVNE